MKTARVEKTENQTDSLFLRFCSLLQSSFDFLRTAMTNHHNLLIDDQNGGAHHAVGHDFLHIGDVFHTGIQFEPRNQPLNIREHAPAGSTTYAKHFDVHFTAPY